MAIDDSIDILENTLRKKGELLDILLRDRTTERNIIWATDSYEKYGKEFAPKKPMKPELVTGVYGKLIQPRAAKPRNEQKQRTKDKAEVFTPLHIVDQMNQSIEQSMADNLSADHKWQDFVAYRMLEITCGEAPFIVSRYNPVNGVSREVHRRVGFLDRKLQVIGKHVDNKQDWLHYAEIALKASYGYEWQGDNLLIARENILYTMNDFYQDFCSKKLKLESNQGLSSGQLEHFAEIISWNIWQMDGLNCTIPMTRVMEKKKIVEDGVGMLSAEILGEKKREYTEEIKKEGKYAKIMDWDIGKKIRFVDMIIQKEL